MAAQSTPAATIAISKRLPRFRRRMGWSPAKRVEDRLSGRTGQNATFCLLFDPFPYTQIMPFPPRPFIGEDRMLRALLLPLLGVFLLTAPAPAADEPITKV